MTIISGIPTQSKVYSLIPAEHRTHEAATTAAQNDDLVWGMASVPKRIGFIGGPVRIAYLCTIYYIVEYRTVFSWYSIVSSDMTGFTGGICLGDP